MSYQDIHVSEVDALLTAPGLTVLDMRDEASRSRGQLPCAQPHNDEVISRLMRLRRSNPPVLIYCYHGNSSRDFCAFLGQMGFDRVYNLEGGWQAWETWQQNLNH